MIHVFGEGYNSHIPHQREDGNMPKKGRVNKEMRLRKKGATDTGKPKGLMEPTRKLSPQELELQKARDKAAGDMQSPTRINRERELARRDRSQEW